MTPVLETPRLILRPAVIADLEAWAAYGADPDVMRHNGGVRSREQVFTALRNSIAAWKREGFHGFSVIHRESGDWMGRVGPRRHDGLTEVGWGLASRWWGQGYATEAAAACLDFVFDALGWDEVVHAVPPDHHASQSVARKLGSVRLDLVELPPPLGVRELWGQTREAWHKARLDPGRVRA
ncbi:hypothetical protein ABAC460_23565 [Asticcacaulis sp. AC460]|uniref:GNAT family N-acetyltransferase n=1 Tax=Asticcacaulis sp. AC460 TaxID=1282360 RepID=UPI0003C3CCCB|nr:GNAT family N-acetyltransferase [Asticcacaulis sp. AC460]ESQ85578.1 hypothetical protein ABAC460_23565 [Asticcacaulis sp. AC460]